MNFSKVKLISGGQHGLLASYVEEELKNGFSFSNTHTCERKLPVPKPLCDLFAKLEDHLRMICTLTAAADIEVTGITSNGSDRFIISGKVRTFSNTVFAVNTPLMQADTEYGMFDEVLEIVKKIYDSANDYFEKKQSADSKQIALDLFHSNPEKVDEVINFEVKEGEARRVLTEQDIEAMTEGDLRPLLVAALERKGCVILEEEVVAPAEPAFKDNEKLAGKRQEALAGDKKMRVAS